MLAAWLVHIGSCSVIVKPVKHMETCIIYRKKVIAATVQTDRLIIDVLVLPPADKSITLHPVLLEHSQTWMTSIFNFCIRMIFNEECSGCKFLSFFFFLLHYDLLCTESWQHLWWPLPARSWLTTRSFICWWRWRWWRKAPSRQRSFCHHQDSFPCHPSDSRTWAGLGPERADVWVMWLF